MNFTSGDRVRISPDCPWGTWAFGTITPPTGLHLAIARPGEWEGCRKTIRYAGRSVDLYYVEFDKPQAHDGGVGFLSGAEIEARFLMPIGPRENS